MKTSKKDVRLVCAATAAALLLLAGCASKSETAPAKATPTAINPTPTVAAASAAVTAAPALTLSPAQEVPPNPSSATGKSTIAVGPDMTVTGTVQVMGMTPTMAHIHEAAPGNNGPVILPFAKTGENTFAPAPGAKLTAAQYASYQQGKLYVNVHSAAYPGGEVRVQLPGK
ncbi:CHRD domain-containing protein [Massilia sp. TWR1-2-2]|uniref:CHRD domain-containing protein n=1 Tax=Massilia sp. TWR1-2-2 TaxID=2804584 RepID=UPI003CF4FA71